MDKVQFLKALAAFTSEVTKDMILPVSLQKEDTEQQFRAPEVYQMRLPDSRQAKKKARTSFIKSSPAPTRRGTKERPPTTRLCGPFFVSTAPMSRKAV